MNIFKAQITPDFVNRVIYQPQIEADIFWIRFGREVLIFTEDEMPEHNLRRQPVHVYSFPKEILQTELYIVAQKGRLFQQHNPTVTVIHDYGRYLLVRLESTLIEKIKNVSCYNFVPLARGQTFFEDHELEDFRRESIPFIQALVDKLKTDNLKKVLEFLTTFKTRFWTSFGYSQAASRMGKLLSDMGYDVRSQPFGTTGGKSFNVIADKQGLGGERKVVLVTAHLDSISETDGENVPAPGADDNGCGCAGLIEIARIFQTHPGEHDLRFILFGCEEKGSIGSKRYVKYLSPEERDRIRAIVNMDMIGYAKSPSQKVLIEGAQISQCVINALLEAAATYTKFSSIQTSLLPQNSDHVSFIDERMPAVLTTEGVEGTNPNIHSPHDTINTINYHFALEILRMNVGYIAKEIGKM